jgi:hypothetical protein
MTWSGNPINIVPASDDANRRAPLARLIAIEPEWDVDATTDRLKHFPRLQEFLTQHTRSGLYVWQYKRDVQPAPTLPLVPTLPQGAQAAKTQNRHHVIAHKHACISGSRQLHMNSHLSGDVLTTAIR